MASIALVWTNYLLHLRTPGRRLILVRREDEDTYEEVPRLMSRYSDYQRMVGGPQKRGCCMQRALKGECVGAIIDVLKLPMEKGGEKLGNGAILKASEFFAAEIDKPGVTIEKAVENAKKVLQRRG